MGPLSQLNDDGKKLVGGASRQAVESSLARTRMWNAARGGWLRETNRYRKECVRMFAKDTRGASKSIRVAGAKPSPKERKTTRELVAYIAASAPCHAADGWSLLGRAVSSALRRDPYSAVHYAYYAELRAAMSILASEGIGILDAKHPTIQCGRTGIEIQPLPKVNMRNSGKAGYKERAAGTHMAVGPCLNYWSTLPRSRKLIGEIVRPLGISLTEWFDGLGKPATGSAVARRWLLAWGLDLDVVAKDRDARNLASYRPSDFRRPEPLSGSELITFFKSFWQLFEPSPGYGFPTLERLLLKRALQEAGVRATASQINGIGVPLALAAELERFFSGQPTAGPSPLDEAEGVSAVDDPRCHLQIIARAAMLLYIASRSAASLLRKAGYHADELKFWWHPLGAARCFWEDGDAPADPANMWADMEANLAEMGEWLAHSGPTGSLREWRREHARTACELGGCELIGIWGLTNL